MSVPPEGNMMPPGSDAGMAPPGMPPPGAMPPPGPGEMAPGPPVPPGPPMYVEEPVVDPNENRINLLLSAVNIAEKLKPEQLNRIGAEICEGFEIDKASRAGWERKSDDALKLASQIVEHKINILFACGQSASPVQAKKP